MYQTSTCYLQDKNFVNQQIFLYKNGYETLKCLMHVGLSLKNGLLLSNLCQIKDLVKQYANFFIFIRFDNFVVASQHMTPKSNNQFQVFKFHTKLNFIHDQMD